VGPVIFGSMLPMTKGHHHGSKSSGRGRSGKLFESSRNSGRADKRDASGITTTRRCCGGEKRCLLQEKRERKAPQETTAGDLTQAKKGGIDLGRSTKIECDALKILNFLILNRGSKPFGPRYAPMINDHAQRIRCPDSGSQKVAGWVWHRCSVRKTG
jgi:hypothetical protein